MYLSKVVAGWVDGERIIWEFKIDGSLERENGGPSFTVTGSGKNVGGMLHDELLLAVDESIKEMHKYCKWHLFNVNRGPLHYIDNALYRFGIGKYSEFNLENFKSTIIFGVMATKKICKEFSDSVEARLQQMVSMMLQQMNKLRAY